VCPNSDGNPNSISKKSESWKIPTTSASKPVECRATQLPGKLDPGKLGSLCIQHFSLQITSS